MTRTSTLPSGVYVLYDISDIIYVGKSVNVASRVKDHVREKRHLFDRVMVLPCAPEELDEFEGLLIRMLNPVKNRIIGKSKRAATVYGFHAGPYISKEDMFSELSMREFHEEESKSDETFERDIGGDEE
ncbi:GIY-YIG nuclease superfamily [uncultured Caudovirales phage]|uniref:GIY-YIG nuclease superfamily n=1 Tax=uncultured Caudovirales phage TaxID=2100421 RepID=A0A6J5KXZ4_9CAUD|nr:GIY-YIG nuclease superfamily [uncultured Caudovirales phage]